MATIARMLVELAGDASGLRRMFQQAARDSATFGAEMRAAISTQPLVSSQAAAEQGRRAAKALSEQLTTTLGTELASAREQVARGLATETEARIAAEKAAVAFNKGMLDGIAQLRAHKMLPADVHAQLVRELQEAGMEAGRAAREAMQQQLRDLGGNLKDIGGNLKSAGRTLTQDVTLPIIALGGASAKMASDAAESFNKFDVVFGRLAAGVRQQLVELHRTIPLTNAELQNQAADFQNLLVPMGLVPSKAAQMSVALVRLGGDIVSLNNTGQKETIQRLFSGLVGEAESVRRFGVDISEARLKILAHNAGLGDNVQALTRAQKAQLIYNEILRGSILAQGDAARTMGSASNSFRFLERDAQEAAQTIGRQLLPTLTTLAQSLSRVLVFIQGLSPQTLDMAIKFALIAAAVGPVLLVLGTLLTTVGTLTIAWATLGPAIAGALAILAGPAGWIVAIGLATAGLLAWLAASNQARQSNQELAESYKYLGQAQLTQQLQAATAREHALLQQQAELQAKTKNAAQGAPIVTATGQVIQQVNPDVARLKEVNQEIETTRDSLRGLGTAWNNLATQQQAQRDEQARIFAQNDAAARALAASMGNTLADAKAAAAAARAARKEQQQELAALAGSVSSLTDLRAEAMRFHQDVTEIDLAAVRTFTQVQRQLDATGGHFDATTARLFNMQQELMKIPAVAAEAARAMRQLAIEKGNALDLRSLIANTPTVAQAATTRAIAQVGAKNVPAGPLPNVTVLPVRPGSFVQTGGPGVGGPAQAPRVLDEGQERLRLATTNFLAALGLSRAELVAFRREVSSVARDVADNLRPLGALVREAVAALPQPIQEAIATVGQELQALGGEIAGKVGAIFGPIRAVVEEVGSRLRPAAALAASALNLVAAGASAARQVMAPVFSALGEIVNPLNFFGGVMREVGSALQPVFEPLRPVLKALADIVARALVPVFQALAPALEALLPLVDAIMQVLAPILTALAPLFRALAAILEPLFPIFKLLGIAATYIGQAFGIAANIVLRAVGNIIIGFGKIVEALARAIDALPFVSAKGAIQMAQNIQNFGRGMLTAADEMKNMANDMARAREEIRGAGVDHNVTASSVEKLGDAAETAAQQLLFVPNIFRLQQRLAEILPAEPWGGSRPITPNAPVTPPQLPAQPPQLVRAPDTAAAPQQPAPPVSQEARPPVPVGMQVQQLVINNPASGEDVVDEIDEAYRRRSMATFGTSQRVGEL